MTKSKSSRRWLDRHFKDEFVKRAQREGYRARAAYKLLEIQEKDHLLKRGMRVVAQAQELLGGCELQSLVASRRHDLVLDRVIAQLEINEGE